MKSMPGTVLFGNARTALKFGLIAIGLKTGDAVLVPEYICDILLHPLEVLGLQPVFYAVDDLLSPDWSSLDDAARAPAARAVVMLHYFGQPANVPRFQKFCWEHNLLLVEDNAHGYGGRLGNRPLGSFGDIAVSSPRKLLRTPTGGTLFISSASSAELPSRRVRPVELLRSLASRSSRLRGALRWMRDRNRDWSDPRVDAEPMLPDQQIDRYSARLISRTAWGELAHRRRANWKAWELFTARAGLQPVFDAVHEESNPWALPVVARDQRERDAWLEWGANTGMTVYPWPCLPEAIVRRNDAALARWQRLVCFGVEQAPPTGVTMPLR